MRACAAVSSVMSKVMIGVLSRNTSVRVAGGSSFCGRGAHVASLLEVNDAGKLVREKAGTAHKSAINVGARHELIDGLWRHGSAILDHHGVSGGLGVVVHKPGADESVCVLSLLGGGREASADGPDGLVCDDHLGEVSLRHTSQVGLELVSDNSVGRARLAFLLELANAEDGREASGEHLLCLLVDERVALAEDGPALRVPSEHMRAADRLQHGGGYRTSEGALVLGPAVLGAKGHVRALKGLGHRSEEGEGGDHGHVGLGTRGRLLHGRREGNSVIELCVHLPVASDERCALSHDHLRH
mmetsp:Transcript_20628/g.55672  ORF Transcript_20628/g.55672 Transcript_20628/m.55672 type:complete len:300 (+) Transcript_20628:295-1194(+)